jgi:hypothetical protein
MHKTLKNIGKQLKRYRDQYRKIDNGKGLSRTQKQLKLKSIEANERRVIDRGLTAYNRAVKKYRD